MSVVKIHVVESFVTKEESEFIFKELSDGIYQVIKAPSKFPSFVDNTIVTNYLNSETKVYVISNIKHYSNFECNI